MAPHITKIDHTQEHVLLQTIAILIAQIMTFHCGVSSYKKSIRNERNTHGWHIQTINEAILLLNAHVNDELILGEDAAGFASFTTDERFISNSVYLTI